MMRPTHALLAVLAAAAWTLPAAATTLVTTRAAFDAGTTGLVTGTPNPGPFDLSQLFLPTTTTIALNDGSSLGLSTPAQVTGTQNGFPYAFANGFDGEIFVAQDADGNQVSRITLTIGGGVSALGFEVAPFSSAMPAPNFGVAGGPYTVSVTLSSGQSSTVSLAGGNDNTGTTPSQFFGFTGGGVSTVTISTSDPNGLGFGNFVDVPEPAAAALVLTGLVGLGWTRRRAPLG